MLNAIIEAYDAHETMSKQALNSEAIQRGIKEILVGPGRLWEMLKEVEGA